MDVRLPAEGLYEQLEAAPDEPFVLQPGAFALATTLERLPLPAHTMARVDGRSSLGRLGVLVHATAGLVDPGFVGRLTLELSNQAPLPVALYPGMRIAQLSFYHLSSPARRPYGERGGRSKYQGQDAPTPSLIHLDFA
ncbi:dCTP deaminase [bacterium HR24]|nr:dCTP deaminase [bacterium HR24]